MREPSNPSPLRDIGLVQRARGLGKYLESAVNTGTVVVSYTSSAYSLLSLRYYLSTALD
jgi:hypothetical protein